MKKNFLSRFFTSILLGPLIIFSLVYLDKYSFYTLLLIIFGTSLYEIFKIKKKIIKFLIFFLLILFTYCCIRIYSLDNGKLIIIYLLILTWLSDIGGYVFGKLIGGKKINFISPNKTFAGFLGSLLFVQVAGYYLKFLNLAFLNETFLNIYFLLICTFVVISGDLLFSFFKRKCLIKDFSNFLPGHGGLLDRIDGLILLIIFIYIFKL